jgi:hypothetical protein
MVLKTLANLQAIMGYIDILGVMSIPKAIVEEEVGFETIQVEIGFGTSYTRTSFETL